MSQESDICLYGELPVNDFKQFQPFKLCRLFCKGGDNKVKETADQKMQARIAAEKWQRAEKTLAPLQNLYMGKVAELNVDEAFDAASGVAAQGTLQAFSGANEQAQKKLNAQVNPNSGKAVTTIASLNDSLSESTGENSARAKQTTLQDYAIGESNIVAMGQGQSTNAQAGMSRLANASISKAGQDAQNAYNEKVNTANTFGSAAGLAAYSLNNRTKEG